jgi:hypothetical protein
MLILFIPNTGRCSIGCVEITVRHFASEAGEREFHIEALKTFKFSNTDIFNKAAANRSLDRPANIPLPKMQRLLGERA